MPLSPFSFSSDGVLFLLHDETFRRTTNIRDVFPKRVDEPAYTFNFSDVQKLNAGQWFLDVSAPAFVFGNQPVLRVADKVKCGRLAIA